MDSKNGRGKEPGRKISFDFDDVLAPTMDSLIRMINDHYGTTYKVDHFIEWDFDKNFDSGIDYAKFIATEEFYHALEPYEDIHYLRKLTDQGDDVLVVTAFMTPADIAGKYAFREKHMPFIPKENFLFTSRKDVVHVDFFLDDRLFNVENSPALHKAVKVQPWNKHATHDFPVFGNLTEFYHFIQKAGRKENVKESRNNIRVAFDFDCVIAKTAEEVLKRVNREHGTDYRMADLTEYDLTKALPEELDAMKHFKAEDFFSGLEPYEGIEGIKRLHEKGYDILIVTAIASGKEAAGKYAFREKHLPFIPAENFIFASRKDIIHADFFIDDLVGNVATSPAAYKGVRKQPWNQGDHGLREFEGLVDFCRFVEEMTEEMEGERR